MKIKTHTTKLISTTITVGSLLLATAVVSTAASVPIVNADFENLANGFNTTGAGTQPFGWTAEGTLNNTGTWLEPAGPSSTGTNGPHTFIDFGGRALGITQTLSTTLLSNTTYEISVDVYGAPTTTSNQIVVTAGTLAAGVDYAGSNGGFSLFGGNFAPGTIQMTNGTTAGVSQSNISGGVDPVNTWGTVSFSFDTNTVDANAGQAINIFIRGGSGTTTNTGQWTLFDNVQLDATPIPEPSSALFMGAAAILGFVFLRRRMTTRSNS